MEWFISGTFNLVLYLTYKLKINLSVKDTFLLYVKIFLIMESLSAVQKETFCSDIAMLELS